MLTTCSVIKGSTGEELDTYMQFEMNIRSM